MMNNKVRSLVFFFFAMTILILVFSCTSQDKKESNETLTVLCYNIHHGEGVDGILSLERIASLINTVSPDIVALQEVDVNTNRTERVNQIEELGKLTNMNSVFGKSMDFDEGQYGNAVLTRFDIIDSTTFPLPGEPRSALAVTLGLDSIDGIEIVFISTHLDTRLKFRKQSIPLIENILDNYESTPLILAGDLNDTPVSEIMQQLFKDLDNATPNIYTVPVDVPEKQIDYILFKPQKEWTVLSSKALDEKVASDHRAIMAVFKLNYEN